jgi:hypothetical protein
MWTWCFRASLYTLFKIDPSRSGDVLIEVLGKEFNGVLGCDCFSAYRRSRREFDVTLQFCLAHLIRDVKFLMTLPGKKEQAYGTRLRDALRTLFGVIHQREQLSAAQFQLRLQVARDEVLRVGQADVPSSRPAQAMAKRLRKHGPSYFTFVTAAGLVLVQAADQGSQLVADHGHPPGVFGNHAGEGLGGRVVHQVAEEDRPRPARLQVPLLP